MKRAFAIILAVVFVFSGVLSASAAQPQARKRVVYVASQPIPKAAAAAARDWFSSSTTAQEIRDIKNLTLEQVKNVKLCRAYTVESFETESHELYHFPLLYENTFIGHLLVLPNFSGSGYHAQFGGGDNFLESLNQFSSSQSAPLTFVYTRENIFVIDSKNKVHWINDYSPYPQEQKERVERQMRDMQKMKRPSRIVPLGADTAYPDQLSQPKDPLLTVKDEKINLVYKSYDGGKTWKNGSKPPVYISIAKAVFYERNGTFPYTVHNDTKNELVTGEPFTMQKWNGQKWVKLPELDNIAFDLYGLIIPPNSSAKLNATWEDYNIKLEVGKYKLIKTLSANNRQFTCEAEFVLV